MESYPLVDFRDLEPDLMNAQDRIINLAVKADRFKRQEELDEMLARELME
jgi:hypothetical protein